MRMNEIEQLRLRVLVIKCQLGDRDALELLYQQFQPALGYYVRRLIGQQQAGDVLQEVWLAVIRNIARLKSPEAFTVWLYRIARSKAMNRLGVDHRHLPLDEEFPASNDSSEPFFATDDVAALHAAIANLRPEHRDVLLLRFMEDLSYEQIAQVVGCGVGTVRSRIFYAKAALKRQLEKNHE